MKGQPKLRGAAGKAAAVAKKEAVLVIAAVCAGVSAFFVPPSPAYGEYIDWRVLCLLFCLMAVVAGLRRCGLFAALAQKLLAGKKSMAFLSLVLVLLPFFTSMLVTNDVALITFVPFALVVLDLTGQTAYMVRIVVLQTVAANLGSMLTPVGNPQNLFLYAKYQLSLGDLFSTTLPLTLVSLAALSLGALLVRPRTIEVHFQEKARVEPKKLALYAGLFLLCLLGVFRVLDCWALLGLVALSMAVFERSLFRKVDYSLLLTFVCFFIFAGNVGRIEAVDNLLSRVMAQNAALASAAASQVISNVPAAVLLSGFTENWRGLLVGVNVGGLGTPIASLASLISLKFYLADPNAKPLRYLGVFLLVNVAGLVLLLFTSFLCGTLV